MVRFTILIKKNAEKYKGKPPPNKRTTEQVVSKFKEVHGDRYDYSKVEFVNQNTKVKIICREHFERYIQA